MYGDITYFNHLRHKTTVEMHYIINTITMHGNK